MHAIRQHLLLTFVAAQLAACGGGDPREAPHSLAAIDAAAQAAVGATGASHRDDDALRATASRVVPAGVIRAGAATTQDAIDSAIASHAATAAIAHPSR
jgi:hypothetical protein